MANIRDVARECGVSVTTVSFVLNNSPRPVSAETRRRVSEAARRLNYHPNAMARGLVQKRSHTLGILMPAVEASVVTNRYASGVLQGVFTEAESRGYDIHLYTSKWVNAETSAPRFRDQRTDGTLIFVPRIGSDLVPGLHALKIPIVVVSTPSDVPGVPSVDVDNAQGATLAARHLLELGHTRIAHVMGRRNQHSVIERRDSFVRTLIEAGLSVPPEYLVGDSFLREEASQTVQELLALPNRPTAIFTTNDDLAMIAMRVAIQAGLRIPQDLSIIGFDNYPSSAEVTPSLTTIDHPLWKVGIAATRLLISQIETGEVEEGPHLFSPHLVVRESTGPAPSV